MGAVDVCVPGKCVNVPLQPILYVPRSLPSLYHLCPQGGHIARDSGEARHRVVRVHRRLCRVFGIDVYRQPPGLQRRSRWCTDFVGDVMFEQNAWVVEWQENGGLER